MVWAKLDDHFPEHRKVWPRSDAAFRLHVAGICLSTKLLTDGLVDADRVQGLVPAFKRKALDELVGSGLWHETDHECEDCPQPPSGVYMIHGFLDSNPSEAKVKKDREAKAERQRQWREKKAAEKAAKDAARDALQDAARDSAPNPTRPDPPRREVGRVVGLAASDDETTEGPEGAEEPDTSLAPEQVELNVTQIGSIRGRLREGPGAA